MIAVLFLVYPLLICGLEPPEVDIPWSHITGIKQVFKNKEIKIFLGIPYAEPPLGYLRFKAPEMLKRINLFGFYAGRFQDNCITVDRYSDFLYFSSLNQDIHPTDNHVRYRQGIQSTKHHPQSENCLYLNLWIPCSSSFKSAENSTSKNSTLKPIAIHILPPESEVNKWDGKSLAILNDQVIISFNYRSGLFGLIEEDINISDNAILYDTKALLDWIENNIHLFGGDAKNITLVAGNWKTSSNDGDHQKLINQLSEVRRELFPANSLSTQVRWQDLNEVSTLVGCDVPVGLRKPRGLNCLRRVQAEDLIQAFLAQNDTLINNEIL